MTSPTLPREQVEGNRNLDPSWIQSSRARAQVEGLQLTNQAFAFSVQRMSLLDDPVMSTAFSLSLKTTTQVN
jgi:hypothetical protein